ncbi:hypothetical protein LARI1_G001009 [Lachnellula arida]|uniref:Uncharacterized protein n=1 Tax=Lachnellula arida TaxID=1316785 RepID=A0A8T9BQ32_9HELO|nr:hypothetical protein LARI1_G001009 [Lachnellula arida]
MKARPCLLSLNDSTVGPAKWVALGIDVLSRLSISEYLTYSFLVHAKTPPSKPSLSIPDYFSSHSDLQTSYRPRDRLSPPPLLCRAPTKLERPADRFIAYLATHAPLDKNGRAPRHEERRERWKTNDIVRMIGERFPKLSGYKIKTNAIEMRLALLDQAGDNDYFKMGYKTYEREEWGRGI